MNRLSLLLAAACAAAAVAAAATPAAAPVPLAPVANALADGDPLGYDPARAAELEQGAAFGHSHVLYRRTPDGVAEAARRTAAFRPLVERAVAGSGFSADVLEAIVFLESAGRPTARASDDPRAASGLAQIMAETATGFLGMKVDVAASGRLTRQIVRARAAGKMRLAQRLAKRRAQVDERFAPAKALAAAVRYLTTARGYLGRNDLAVVSYHMGIGNLQNVLAAYGASDVPYVQLYFDVAPDRHPDAWRRLSRLSDDSLNYYWKVLAAKRIMALHRTNPAQLDTLTALHARKLSHEEVMHPPASTPTFRRSKGIVAARRAGTLLPLPERPVRLRVTVAAEAGEMAQRVGRSSTVYRALRPEALATLLYMGQRIHELSGAEAPLVVTSAVRDEVYQRVLMRRNPMAARVYSVHTTGYAFDVARNWRSPRHADAVQFVLERLEAQGLIAYIKEPGAIHIAVSKRARVLVPAMLRKPGAPAPAGGIGEAVVTELAPPPAPRKAPPQQPKAVEPKSWLDVLRERIAAL